MAGTVTVLRPGEWGLHVHDGRRRRRRCRHRCERDRFAADQGGRLDSFARDGRRRGRGRRGRHHAHARCIDWEWSRSDDHNRHAWQQRSRRTGGRVISIEVLMRSRSRSGRRRVLHDLLRGSVERSHGVAVRRWHARRRASAGDGGGVSIAWIVLGRWVLVVCGRLSANERTNPLVGALFVRSHRSQDDDRRHRPCVRSLASLAGHGPGRRADLRSFARRPRGRG